MTIEEYERKIKEATDASIVAQAQNNAAQAEAVASAVGNAAMAAGQQMSGGVGEAPEWETQQERQQNQQAMNDAVERSTSSVELPGSGMTDEQKKQVIEEAVNETTQPLPPKEEAAKVAAPEPAQEESQEGNVNSTVVGTGDNSEADLLKAQAALDQADEDLLKAVKDANEQQNKSFTDMVNDYVKEKEAREEEMRRQEQANMLSTMGSSFAELGAGLANLFTVAGGASNQQYRNYSADWMKKAERDILDNRRRRENMYDVLQRMKLQQDQMRAANRIEELKIKKASAKDAYDRIRQAQKDAEARADKEWQKGITERQIANQEKNQERSAKQTDATIAQGWAKINDAKEARQATQDATMLTYGYVPDASQPGGYRYDPTKAARGVGGSGSGSGGLVIPLMAYGNLPEETIRVKDEKALQTIIYSNIDAVTDLTMMQKDALVRMMEDDSIDAEKKARELRRYLVSSGQLRALFRNNTVQDNSADTGDGWLFRQYETGAVGSK